MLYRIKNVISDGRLNLLGSRLCFAALIFSLAACGGSSGGSASTVEAGLSISGKVTVPSDSDVDLDLNGSPELNNDPADPQIINNPATIGGYLSGYAGNYEAGNSFNADQLDHFSVSLVQGQEINVSLFQADEQLSNIDFSLALLDDTEQVLAELNLTTFSANTLVVPSDGLFVLELRVTAGSDPALYTVSLSQTLNKQDAAMSHTAMLSQHPALSNAFVPGEVLVRYKASDQYLSTVEAKNGAVSSLATHAAFEQNNALDLLEDIPGVATRYRFSPQRLAKAVSLAKSSNEDVLNHLELKLQTLALIETLKESPELVFVEPNYLYRTTASTNDPRLSEQWSLSMLATGAAWEASTGQNVVVAVLDTGIDASHEDLQAKVLTSGYDFISSTSASGDGNGFDTDPNDEGSSFHGSHVAGIISAQADNAKGIAGVAYDAGIMPLRVLGVQDTGSSSDIAQAILYAAGLNNSSGQLPATKADIINMSFGGDARSETVKAALDQAFQAGLILVAAAGNAGSDSPFYPAAFENVVGVGALSSDKNRASFSNFGLNVQLVAPGGSGSGSADFDGFEDAILSTINANNYRELAGTSMAAPHVSGVAALMKALKNDLTGPHFISALDSGALTDVIKPGVMDTHNFYGAGLINAAKSVKWAAGANIIPATLSIYPMQFGFIGGNTKAELSLLNSGTGLLVINEITASDNWIALSPKQLDQNGLGTYEVEVSVTQAPIDQGEIVIAYQINDEPEQYERLNVFISRSNQTDSSAGTVFISLFKEEDILNDRFQPFVTVGGRLADGAYTYCFNNVPSGRYLLSASTDNDGDQLAFDTGEATGTFPLLSRPDFIQLTDLSLNKVNFDIQYPAFLNSGASGQSASVSSKTYLSRSGDLADKLSMTFKKGIMLNANDRGSEFSSQSTCLN